MAQQKTGSLMVGRLKNKGSKEFDKCRICGDCLPKDFLKDRDFVCSWCEGKEDGRS